MNVCIAFHQLVDKNSHVITRCACVAYSCFFHRDLGVAFVIKAIAIHIKQPHLGEGIKCQPQVMCVVWGCFNHTVYNFFLKKSC